MQVTVTFEENDLQDSGKLTAFLALFGSTTAATLPTLPMPASRWPVPVQAAAAPVAAAPVQSVEPSEQATHDSSGLVWDSRIHSPNRTQNADGTWRKKKGLDPAIYAAIESDLRNTAPAPVQSHDQQAINDTAASLFGQFAPADPAAGMTASEAHDALFGQFAPTPVQAAPTPVQAAPTPVQAAPTPVQAAPVQAAPVQAAPTPVQAAPVQAAPVQAAPVQAAPVQAAPATFPDFMKVLSGGVNSGKIDPGYIGEFTQRMQITSIADLASQPAKIPQAYATLVADGKV